MIIYNRKQESNKKRKKTHSQLSRKKVVFFSWSLSWSKVCFISWPSSFFSWLLSWSKVCFLSFFLVSYFFYWLLTCFLSFFLNLKRVFFYFYIFLNITFFPGRSVSSLFLFLKSFFCSSEAALQFTFFSIHPSICPYNIICYARTDGRTNLKILKFALRVAPHFKQVLRGLMGQ